MAAMTCPLTATAAALVPSGSTARRDRTTKSYLIWLRCKSVSKSELPARRPGEGVDLAVGWHRVGERPPELHRAEPGGPRGPGPLQQRQLGEQDRAVDVEPQPVCAH